MPQRTQQTCEREDQSNEQAKGLSLACSFFNWREKYNSAWAFNICPSVLMSKKSVRDAVRTYISHAEFAELRKDYAGHNLDKIDYAETYFASLVCSIRTAFLLNPPFICTVKTLCNSASPAWENTIPHEHLIYVLLYLCQKSVRDAVRTADAKYCVPTRDSV